MGNKLDSSEKLEGIIDDLENQIDDIKGFGSVLTKIQTLSDKVGMLGEKLSNNVGEYIDVKESLAFEVSSLKTVKNDNVKILADIKNRDNMLASQFDDYSNHLTLITKEIVGVKCRITAMVKADIERKSSDEEMLSELRNKIGSLAQTLEKRISHNSSELKSLSEKVTSFDWKMLKYLHLAIISTTALQLIAGYFLFYHVN